MINKTFNIERLVTDLKSAASSSQAPKIIRDILEKAVADPDTVASGIPDFEENDVILFEDDTISIWHSRFMPGLSVPPHDHQMSAVIAVYRGSELNQLYERDPSGGIRKSSKVEVLAGEVFSIGPNAIHGVTCSSKEPCCAFHVYLGNLTKVERSLFDVEAGVVMKFTDENYALITRPNDY